MGGFGLLYGVLALRLVVLGVAADGKTQDARSLRRRRRRVPISSTATGETLATDIKTASSSPSPATL
jgi:hypothetical protein